MIEGKGLCLSSKSGIHKCSFKQDVIKASTHEGFCSWVILHVSVHTREHFQVCSICPGILLPNNFVEHFVGLKFCSQE